jgi:hypothetical protein
MTGRKPAVLSAEAACNPAPQLNPVIGAVDPRNCISQLKAI